MHIRNATPDDAPLLAALILDLAAYEKLENEASPDAGALAFHLSPRAHPRCEALIAETGDGGAAGFARFFHNYSTFHTNWGVYLEDLFVKPEYRSQGVGFALLKRVAEIAVERGSVRLEWSVLDWNEPALRFYKRLGARAMNDWTAMRLSGKALESLGTMHHSSTPE
jgi:GNAT superfamily N-acetyltransferase